MNNYSVKTPYSYKKSYEIFAISFANPHFVIILQDLAQIFVLL
jgi:hypothetical protein